MPTYINSPYISLLPSIPPSSIPLFFLLPSSLSSLLPSSLCTLSDSSLFISLSLTCSLKSFVIFIWFSHLFIEYFAPSDLLYCVGEGGEREGERERGRERERENEREREREGGRGERNKSVAMKKE
ncbi:unnamed protein product [Boreogadus saida]